MQVIEILQTHIPEDMRGPVSLPGTRPEKGSWLRRDEAYEAQMAERERLLSTQAGNVLYGEGIDAAHELFDMSVVEGASLGVIRQPNSVLRPDGVDIPIAAPLATLGHVFQSDFAIMEKQGDAHVLTAAVLCFPASWRLTEKAGRALGPIHHPVAVYDTNIARRVQRLFDGVQAGRPLMRFNRLWYEDATLYQPRSVTAPRREVTRIQDAPYMRSERQTLVRLPLSKAVVFVIHTYVLRAADAHAQLHGF